MAGLYPLLLAVSASPAQAADPGDFSVIGHRGWVESSSIVENSRRAVVRAATNGATAVEVDVRMTKDRAFVLMHDATLWRTTTRRGWVHLTPESVIKRRTRLRDGQRVPFVPAILAVAEQHDLNLVLEIKDDRLDRWRTRDFQRLASLIRLAGMRSRVALLAFDDRLLRMAEHVDQRLPTIWIARSTPVVPDVLARGVDAVAVRSDHLEPVVAEGLSAAGVAIYGRSSIDPSAWETYALHGAVGVLTDALRTYVAWLGTWTPPAE